MRREFDPFWGVILFSICIYMCVTEIISNNTKYNEYITLNDVRQVNAEVVKVDVEVINVNVNSRHSLEKKRKNIIYNYYVKYSVDNIPYNDKLVKVYVREPQKTMKVGDITAVEVYKDRSSGTYKIPITPSKQNRNDNNFPQYIYLSMSILFWIFSVADILSKAKQNNKKYNFKNVAYSEKKETGSSWRQND